MGRKTIAAVGLLGIILQGYAGEYDIAKPWNSPALSPVAITKHAGLPPLRIASQGRALTPIVCADAAYYGDIASLLKKYLDQACGANFIITNQPPGEGRAIFVSPCGLPAVQAVFDRAQILPPESLAVACVPEGLVLAGKDAECENRLIAKAGLDINDRNQSRGTFFAALDFLERLVGVRFYFPGIGLHVPDYTRTDLSIPSVSYTDTPVFDMRALGYGGGSDMRLIKTTRADALFWNILMRLGDVKLRMGWHNDAHWHLVYGQAHPEYFALRTDGTRAVGDRGKYSAFRCYTSKDGFNAHIDAIGRWYGGGFQTKQDCELFLACNREFGPNRRYINWGIADAFRGCHCEECLKLTDPNTPGGLYSKFIWRYFIDLAKACKERWPDKALLTMTYGQYKYIPDFVARENPGNMIIFPASHGVMGHSAAFLKESNVWAACMRHLKQLSALSCERPHIWEHYPHAPRSTGFTIPYMAPHYYQQYFAAMKDKISGSLFNGDRRYSYALDSLMLYMMYKINWNPDFNVDVCVDEYCAVMFGPAAPEMLDYYRTIIDRWEKVKWRNLPDPEKVCYNSGLPKTVYWVETYPRNIRDELEGILRQALAKTEAGTIYYDRAKFMVDGTAPFFQQGRFFDLGKVYQYNCMPYTPDRDKGLRADQWRPAGIRPLVLARNDTGEPDDIVKSQIFMSYDKSNLYISGKIEQPDAFVTKGDGKKVERDGDIWSKDSLEIFLCTEQPGLAEAGLDQLGQYHQVVIDPDGSIFDGVKSIDGGFDIGANLDFTSKTIACREPPRFYFDLVIPFSELGCVLPKPGSQWHLNFYWNRQRDGKALSYTWAGTGAHHDSSRFGLLEFQPGRPDGQPEARP